ncbi:HAD family hydrolase [Chloroflexota bacterium]
MGESLIKKTQVPPVYDSNTYVSHRQPKALLVDLDDTIVTDDAVSEKMWRAVCRRFAPLVGNISADTLYATIKNVAKNYWRDSENHRKGRLNLAATRRELVSLALRKIDLNDDRLADAISDMYTSKKELAIAPIPGAIETLLSFKDIGVRLALITNGSADIQRGKICKFGLDSIFDFILIEGEFGIGKPHASVFTTAIGNLSVVASETWMVGDDLERDIAGAQRIGIYSIWVDWRGSGIPLTSSVYPDRIIGDLRQLSGSIS